VTAHQAGYKITVGFKQRAKLHRERAFWFPLEYEPMRYVVEVTVESEPKRSLELDGLPPLPVPGETVALQSGEQTAYGVVRHRHFEFAAPDVCRISLVCVRDNH
jgi:hypothetical protein